MPEEQNAIGKLEHEKSVLEREHASIVEAIHELRQRARQKSLEASSTRTPLPETEIAFWKDNIKKSQSELMAVQSKLGAVNKALREAKADQPIRALSQLPREVAVNSAPSQCKDPRRDGETKPGRVLFLEFFLQLCEEGLDPRLFRAFESGAHQLVDEFKKTHAHDKEAS
jgi:hypothetical protein